MRNAIFMLAAALVLAGCFMPASIANRAAARDMERVRAEAAAEWRRLDGIMAQRGWRPVGEPDEGALEERYDESDEIRLTLPATGTYTMLAICGGNCLDMDLDVRNAAGERVVADFEPDDTPIVTFQGREGERFRVVLTIPDCRRPPRQPGMDEDPMWRCIYYTRLYRRG